MFQNVHRFLGPLWVMWVGLLFGGMVLNGFEHIGSDGFLKATRLASSLVLVVAAWVWVASASGNRVIFPLYGLAIGMTLGFVGDVSNSQMLISNGEQALLGGALAFGIGHVAYIWACVRARSDLGRPNLSLWLFAIAVWQCIGIVGWYLVVHPVEPKVAIHWVALPYSLLLAGTAGVTMGMALADRRFWILAAGGAVFLASDLVLAIQQFRWDVSIAQTLIGWTGWSSGYGPRLMQEVSRNACWLLYGPAQMLIVYSAASFLKVYRDARAPVETSS